MQRLSDSDDDLDDIAEDPARSLFQCIGSMTSDMIETQLRAIQYPRDSSENLLDYLHRHDELASPAMAARNMLGRFLARARTHAVVAMLVLRYVDVHQLWQTTSDENIKLRDKFVNDLKTGPVVHAILASATMSRLSKVPRIVVTPSPNDNTPSSNDNTHSADENMQSSNENTHTGDQDPQSSNKNMQSSNDDMHSGNGDTHLFDDIAQSTYENTPSANNSKDITSTTNGHTNQAQSIANAPVSNDNNDTSFITKDHVSEAQNIVDTPLLNNNNNNTSIVATGYINEVQSIFNTPLSNENNDTWISTNDHVNEVQSIPRMPSSDDNNDRSIITSAHINEVQSIPDMPWMEDNNDASTMSNGCTNGHRGHSQADDSALLIMPTLMGRSVRSISIRQSASISGHLMTTAWALSHNFDEEQLLQTLDPRLAAQLVNHLDRLLLSGISRLDPLVIPLAAVPADGRTNQLSSPLGLFSGELVFRPVTAQPLMHRNSTCYGQVRYVMYWLHHCIVSREPAIYLDSLPPTLCSECSLVLKRFCCTFRALCNVLSAEDSKCAQLKSCCLAVRMWVHHVGVWLVTQNGSLFLDCIPFNVCLRYGRLLSIFGANISSLQES